MGLATIVILNAAILSNAAYRNSDGLLSYLASPGWTVLGSDPVPSGPFASHELPKPPSAPLPPTWGTYFGEGVGNSNFLFDNSNEQGLAARRGDTLAIAFRGTDTFVDKFDRLDFQTSPPTGPIFGALCDSKKMKVSSVAISHSIGETHELV